MDRAVHLMRRARTGEPKYLFLLCSHNSGSTLLWRILQTSPFVSALPKEGQALEQVREIMMPNRWNEDKQIDWPQVRQTWERIWDMSKPVLLEKSPPHLIRARQLAAHFPNAHFIVTVRNPYAYCEGTRRRWTPEKSYAQIAETWVRHGRHQMANIGNLPRVAALSYEDLVTDQPGARRRLLDFLPDLRWIAVGDSFRVHSIYGDEDLPVVNLNDTQIARLTGQNIDEINAVLYDAPDVMGFFHYEYL
jgi:hypothetical protein